MTQDFRPVSALDSPRFAGIGTFMRLPHVPIEEADNVDIGLIGVPWDGGTTNRAGPRHGPRQVRDMSSMIRTYHHALKIAPFEMINAADLGDCPVNPIDLTDGLQRIETYYKDVVERGIIPMTAGGDHTISLPILGAIGREKPVGMIHFDAHSDLNEGYFGGNKITHGTPFKRAIEEGVLDPKRTIQIGLRGSVVDFADREYGAKMGVRMVDIEEAVELGPEKMMREARSVVGNGPVYISFDIDCLDPAFAPGTGTPEAGGFTTREAQFMLRGLRGLDIVGADMVEVSPPFDPSGYTALAGVTMMFEMLCVMAETIHARKTG